MTISTMTATRIPAMPKPPTSTVAPSLTSASASATEAAILLIMERSPGTGGALADAQRARRNTSDDRAAPASTPAKANSISKFVLITNTCSYNE